MKKHSKTLAVAAIGLGVGGLVWWLTRQTAPAATQDTSAVTGLRALRGFSQSLAYENASMLKPLAQAGMQRLIFRRTM